MLSEMLEAAARRPLRLNVHLCLPRSIVRAAHALHQSLVGQVPSKVRLDPTSLHQPHLTLSMGYVEGLDQLTDAARTVSALAATLPPVDLQVTRSSRHPAREPEFAYYFLDIAASPALLDMRERVHETLDGRYVDVGRPEFPFVPHVTIGYCDATAAPVLASVEPQVATARRLGLALAGDHGVCLGRLSEHYLAGA